MTPSPNAAAAAGEICIRGNLLALLESYKPEDAAAHVAAIIDRHMRGLPQLAESNGLLAHDTAIELAKVRAELAGLREAADKMGALLKKVWDYKHGNPPYRFSGMSDFDRSMAALEAWEVIETELSAYAAAKAKPAEDPNQEVLPL